MKSFTNQFYLIIYIGISINKLNEVWYEKAFWTYIQFRNKHNFDHIDAWKGYAEPNVNHIFILFPEKQKEAKEAIEENFKSLWNKYGDHIVNNELDKNFKSQQRESLKILLLYALGAEPQPIITSPLKITPASPYYVGDTINAEFNITNQGKLPINFSVLTVGGRDPDDQVADFTHRQNITIGPFEYYNYKGTLTLKKLGDYHFFCTYQTLDGEWNTCVDLGSGLTDDDRIEDIIVEEKPSTAEQVTKEKLLIDSSLYSFKHSAPEPPGYLPVSVRGPAGGLELTLANPEGKTDFQFISKRELIDNFETVKLNMGDEPLSRGPYILTVKTVTPEKVIYKTELWFTLPDVFIADAEFTYEITYLGGAYGYAGYYFLEITSLTLINNGDLPAKIDTDKRALITLDGKPGNMTLLTRPYSISPYEKTFFPHYYIPNGKNRIPARHLHVVDAMYGLKKGQYFVTITIPLMGGEIVSFKKALTIE